MVGVNGVYWHIAVLTHVLSVAAFELQWQSWILVTVIVEVHKASSIYCLALYRKRVGLSSIREQ